MILSTENIQRWQIVIHFYNHLAFAETKRFGSETVVFFIDPKSTLTISSYELFVTDVTHIDRDDNPCVEEEEGHVDLWQCLEEHISPANCTLPWKLQSGNLTPFCSHPEDLDRLVSDYEEVFFMDTESIMKSTECRPSCKRNEYTMKHHSTDIEEKETEGEGGVWHAQFFFGRDQFPVVEHYYTYDFSAFVADFGGYLGLLLGHSLLAFFDTVAPLLRRLDPTGSK